VQFASQVQLLLLMTSSRLPFLQSFSKSQSVKIITPSMLCTVKKKTARTQKWLLTLPARLPRSTFTTRAPCKFVLVAVCASKSCLLSETHSALCTHLHVHFDCLQATYDQLHAQVPCSDRADHVMLCPGAGPAGRLLQRGQCSQGPLRPVSFGSLSSPLAWSTCIASYGASLIYEFTAFVAMCRMQIPF